MRLALENPQLGYEKLQGELEKLGCEVVVSTVQDVLKRHYILPAPERGRTHHSWQTFLNHYRLQMFACDFFTIETVLLQTVYLLFFIEVARVGGTWLAVLTDQIQRGSHNKLGSCFDSFRIVSSASAS